VWRSTVQKFCSGGSGFDPSFSETEKVRVVGVVSPPSAAEGSGEVAIARVLRLLRDGGGTTIDCFIHF